MADIDPRFQVVHEQLSDAIGNARELPYSQIGDNLQALVVEAGSFDFLDSLARETQLIGERVVATDQLLIHVQDVLGQAINSPDISRGYPGLKNDLGYIVDVWSGQTKSQAWNDLKWTSRDTASEAMVEIKSFVHGLIPFLLDGSTPTADKKVKLEEYIAYLNITAPPADGLDATLKTFAEDVSSCVEKWQEIYEKYRDSIGNQFLDGFLAEWESLAYTLTDLSEKTHQLATGLGLLPLSSGVSSSLSSAIPSPWIEVMMNTLGGHVSNPLRLAINSEKDEVPANLDHKRQQYLDLDAKQNATARVHLNLMYCNMEVNALVQMLQAFINVWTNLVHDVTTIKDWSVGYSEEYIQHLQATQVQYQALHKGLEQYVDAVSH
ncbi:hypothetical protein EUX98_g3779 [Antrodiella citrinella]|uniref:Uncharacterized protein n=1 Tax=Antrodiella citrinella TaxID=2447956 RepID=A0A4V3XIT2_9APHY|nr:hypothetical protein EUX98_g3779 [Antrodiella citrinella]